MTQMHRAGLVQRYCNPAVHPTGRPEYIYCGKARGPARSYRSLHHALAVSEVSVCLTCWTDTSNEFTSKFFAPSEVQLQLRIIPDAVFVVEKGNKALLFFLEVDLGTEAIAGNGYAFSDKLCAYAAYFDAGHCATDLGPLGKFNGFRVAVVTESESRLQNIRQLSESLSADFILLKTLRDLAADSFPDSWITSAGAAVDLVGRQGSMGGEDRLSIQKASSITNDT
jgi:hypothetical protein